MVLDLSGRVRQIAAIVALVGVTLGGGVAVGLIGPPGVAGVDNRFGDVNDTTTTVETTVTVSNPNPVGVDLGVGVDYRVRLNDVELAAGTKDGVSIGRGETPVSITSHVSNEHIPAWWVSHVRNGEETTVSVDATVRSSTLGGSFDAPTVRRHVETDLLSGFNSTETRPVNANSSAVRDPALYVNETNASWGRPSEAVTPISLRFVVYNPKAYPVPVSELGYEVTMNDVAVGEGETAREYVIPPKSARTVETIAYVRNDAIDEWWVSHLERDQRTQLRIDFEAQLDLGGATIRIPLDPLTHERTIETDIFGTKNESAGRTSGTPTGTAAETPTDRSVESNEDSETATPTATENDATENDATETTTETQTTETPTDDGGLLGVQSIGRSSRSSA